MFELQKNTIDHIKSPEKFYPTMIFSKTLTKILELKKFKIPETNFQTWCADEKFLIMIKYYKSIKRS